MRCSVMCCNVAGVSGCNDNEPITTQSLPLPPVDVQHLASLQGAKATMGLHQHTITAADDPCHVFEYSVKQPRA